MKNVLLIAPSWVNLHQDIIGGLEAMGNYVEYIPEYSFKGDPLRIKARGLVVMNDAKANLKKTEYWKGYLGKTDTIFDFLLVIDGQGVNNTLFEELKKRNQNVYMVNYLYDTTYSMYHFEENFLFYNDVFTFDNRDAAKYHIKTLPIYWQRTNVEKNDRYKYDVFGLGAYSDNRYRLYRQVKLLADEMGKSSFIKLYAPPVKHDLLQKAKDMLKWITGRRNYISYKLYKSDFITSELISTDEFRRYVQMSEIVLDTKVLNQEGLTARFMWALGAGKKIITTNDSVRNYDFYDANQILVLEDCLFTESDKQAILDFIDAKYVHTKDRQHLVEKYRLDNWLKTVLTITNGGSVII